MEDATKNSGGVATELERQSTGLKPFTNYNCTTGCRKYGRYTGAYRDPKPSDEYCPCGALLTEDTPDGHRYRVEFESISPHQAAEMEARYGKGVWPTLSDEEWDGLSWCPVSREDASLHSIENQYKDLRQSADSRRQPIRNVRMLRTKSTWEAVNVPA